MTKKMLIDAAHPEEVRVCVLDNGAVEDFDFESSSRKPLRGNIYLARVTRVEPSLQAAFVEYGGNRHGFLAFSEIHPDYYQIPVSDRRILQEAEAEEATLAAELESDDSGEGAGDDAEAAADDDDDGGDDAGDNLAPDRTDDDAFVEDDSDERFGSDRDDEDAADAQSEQGADAEDAGQSRAAREDGEESAAESASDGDGGAAADAGDDAPAAQQGRAANGGRRGQNGDRRKRAALLERYREARRKRARLLRNYKIQEVIKRRQILLVQVVKEERGNKGAALTTYISLAGRYCVLMPNTARGGGISRKIPVAADRKRLRRVVDTLDVPAGMGLIIRTAGAKRTKAEIKRDYEYLIRLWENIRTLTLQSIAPCLIFEEASLIKRAIRDLYDKDIELVTVEGEAGYREAKDFMKMLMPSHAKNVQQYKEPTPLFIRHDVESQLDAMYQPVVRLKSGGYIVIHQTEALVAIDVNSGKSTRERNIELTALKTNLEAAREAARQCRLRDLAGLIVIDFIDMEESKNNRIVEKRLKDALKFDRARLQVGRISNFGLLEMSRQRRRSGIVDGTTHACPTCSGAGVIRSSETAALRILRAIEREAIGSRAGELIARASIEVTLYILNHKRDWLKRIEDSYGVSIEIAADSSKAGDIFEIEKRGAAREAGPALQVVRADQTETIESELPPPQVEDLDDEATDAPDEARDAEQRAEGDGGRRRRRRRRGGRRHESGGAPDPMRAAPQAADAEADEADAEDGLNDEDGAPRATANGERQADGQRRRRRRGRRGGRRNRTQAEGGLEPAARSDEGAAIDAAPGDDPAPRLEAPAEDSPRFETSFSLRREDAPEAPSVPAAEAPHAGAERHAASAEPPSSAKAPQRLAALPDTPPKPERAKRGWWQRAIGG